METYLSRSARSLSFSVRMVTSVVARPVSAASALTLHAGQSHTARSPRACSLQESHDTAPG